MSVCRKLPDGTVQKIAGHTILLDANAAEIRSGTIQFNGTPAGGTKRVDVTFSDPMPDTDYIVIVNEITEHSHNFVDIYTNTKTTTGFSCSVTSTYSSSLDISYKYYAFKLVKLDGYTALQNKVNNPDNTPTIDSMNLVTSDGVARAIKNASAVWKGTKAEWNALPAAEKQTYDLAVLLDETLVKAVDREDGTETDVANLNKIFRGTEAEWQALSAAEKDEYDEAITTGEQNPIAWPFPRPDWANAVSITAAQLNAGYTAPSDGMFVGRWVNSSSAGAEMTINNVAVGVASNNTSGMLQCPVSSGDVIKNGGTTGTSGISFVPWKQA